MIHAVFTGSYENTRLLTLLDGPPGLNVYYSRFRKAEGIPAPSRRAFLEAGELLHEIAEEQRREKKWGKNRAEAFLDWLEQNYSGRFKAVEHYGEFYI